MEKLFRHGPKMKRVLLTRVIHGYAYNVNSSYRGNTLYIQCRDKQCCPGRGKITGNEQFTLTKEHNHAPLPLLEVLLEFENALYNALMADPFKSPRSLYDEISVLYPQASIYRTWNVMMRVMQNWRLYQQPPIPNNFLEYINVLQEPRWERFVGAGEQEMHVAYIYIDEENHLVIYTNLHLLQMLESNQFYIDCTFKVVPNKPHTLQLLTILTQVSDSVVPIYWALTNRKKIETYQAAIQYFAQLAPRIQPIIFMVDFESSLTTALRNTYPNASIKHCYFHFSQAIVKRLKKQRILTCLINSTVGQIFIRKILALPLLPARDIIIAFNWIVENLPDVMKNLLNKFISYFRRQWLRNVSPEGFSVYKLSNRTNNFSESYNRVLKERLGIHPNIWCFTSTLQTLQSVSLNEYKSLQRGNSIKRSIRPSSVIQNRTIEHAWFLYENRLINMQEFLSCASFFLKAFRSHNIHHETEFIEIIRIEGENQNWGEYQVIQQYQNLPVFAEVDMYQLRFQIGAQH